MARKVNTWGITIAPLMVIVAAFLALWYVGSSTAETLVCASYELLKLAFIILFIAFLAPVIINAIHPFWRRTFYTQFEGAQSKDLEEVKKAIARLKGAGKPKTK
ncbi:MAG TPA: hypothetical protein G4N91_01075 [Dehalococcoidia bacterium]|nr:hypothetical protein [Dehalococcoidia bacterium]